MNEIKPIRQKTIVEQALNEIKNLIETNSMQPGQQLPPEDDLANKFGISKQSIREAIKVFDYLGIISTEPGKGSFISKKSDIASKILIWAIILGDIDKCDLIDVRELFERKGIIEITNYVKTDPEKASHFLIELETHLSMLKKAIEGKNDEKLIEADYLFHETIISGTENELFVDLYETFQYYIKNVIQNTQISTSNPEDLLRYHENIFTAVSEGNDEKALAALASHMKSACWDQIKMTKPLN